VHWDSSRNLTHDLDEDSLEKKNLMPKAPFGGEGKYTLGLDPKIEPMISDLNKKINEESNVKKKLWVEHIISIVR
jgi:hypothetical protein